MKKINSCFWIAILVLVPTLQAFSAAEVLETHDYVSAHLPCEGGEASSYEEMVKLIQSNMDSCHSYKCSAICNGQGTHCRTFNAKISHRPPYNWIVSCFCCR